MGKIKSATQLLHHRVSKTREPSLSLSLDEKERVIFLSSAAGFACTLSGKMDRYSGGRFRQKLEEAAHSSQSLFMRLFNLLSTGNAPLSVLLFFLELTCGTVSAEHGGEALWG